jgi:hypothetical protein
LHFKRTDELNLKYLIDLASGELLQLAKKNLLHPHKLVIAILLNFAASYWPLTMDEAKAIEDEIQGMIVDKDFAALHYLYLLTTLRFV